MLLRRATFDLIGLPPAPQEIRDFVADESPQAFERVIDRLLASPHYGERWGRHWLDVVRYADTAGETADYPVPQAYKYRNWVIDALNRDEPYDQFVREQVAGDLLAAAGPADQYAQRITATGYVAISRRFGFDPQNYQHLTIADTIDTLGRSVLGLSIGCARCHDHKYDPISTRDYYALYGIFASTRYAFPGSEERKTPSDFVPLIPPAEAKAAAEAQQAELARLEAAEKQADAEHKTLTAQLAELTKAAEGGAAAAQADPAAAERQVQLESLKNQAAEKQKARDTLHNERDALAARGPYESAYGVVEGEAADARIQRRGEPTRRATWRPGDSWRFSAGSHFPQARPAAAGVNWPTGSSEPASRWRPA